MLHDYMTRKLLFALFLDFGVGYFPITWASRRVDPCKSSGLAAGVSGFNQQNSWRVSVGLLHYPANVGEEKVRGDFHRFLSSATSTLPSFLSSATANALISTGIHEDEAVVCCRALVLQFPRECSVALGSGP